MMSLSFKDLLFEF
ncbi:hypothetical protein LINPERPRIM_LOCUS992 [Linum perenne]